MRGHNHLPERGTADRERDPDAPFAPAAATGLFLLRSAFDAASGALRRLPFAGEIHDLRWPSHLHINVVPEARGTACSVRGRGVRGVLEKSRRHTTQPARTAGARPAFS